MKLSEHRIERIALAVAIVVSAWLALHAMLLAWGEYLYPSSLVVTRAEKTVELVSSDHPQQLVYENERVRITIGYDQAHAIFEGKLEAADEEHEVYFARRDLTEFEARMDGVELEVLDEPGDEYLLVSALEAGTATVYDNHTRSQADHIHVWRYDVVCPGWCGSGWVEFYYPPRSPLLPRGDPFLKVMTWVS